jgi:hypothetical protein
MNDISEPRRYPSRFSLRTLFVVVLIVALGVALFLATRELLDLRGENARLRAEAGYLTAEDPDKVAVRLIHTLDDFTWRWKTHLPKGRWILHSATRNIPQIGFPNAADSSHATSYGSVATTAIDSPIEASVRKSAGGQWQVVTEFRGGVRWPLDPTHALTVPSSTSSEVAGGGREETFDPNKPIVLLRVRAASTTPGVPSQNTRTIPTTPCDGLMLWLERKEN